MKKTGLALCLSGLLGACGGSESGGQDPAGADGQAPHVLLISIDSLRADHCTPYGYEPEFAPQERTTPFLDRLAREGLLFERMSASSSWTLPSHLSLFSAQPPREHGVRVGRQMLNRDGSVRLAGQFQQAGYATYGVWSAPFLHPAYGYQGSSGSEFDRYEAAEDYLRSGENQQIITNPRMKRMMEVHGLADATYDNSPRVNDIALAWLEEHTSDNPNQPFFMFLHYWDAHYHYVPSDELAERFLPGYSEEDRVLGENFTPAHGDQEAPSYTQDELGRIKALYDAEIRAVDDAIAAVYAKLEELGIADNTVVAITSDHGDHFGEQHEGSEHLFHHRTLFEEVVHVPFVVRAPGRAPAGVRVGGSVALYDVGPTLLDLAGLPTWEGVTGRSARPLWEDPSAVGHEVLMDLFHPGVPTQTQAWRQGDDKAIWEMGSPATRNAPQGAQPYFRAYDLAQDPTEQSPIEDLRERTAWERAQELMRAQAQATRSAPPMEELPDTVRAGLENTGYVDSLDGN